MIIIAKNHLINFDHVRGITTSDNSLVIHQSGADPESCWFRIILKNKIDAINAFSWIRDAVIDGAPSIDITELEE